MWSNYYMSAINNLIWCMETKSNREEEAHKEDYQSVNVYEHISFLPAAWCPLNHENFYTVNIYWKKMTHVDRCVMDLLLNVAKTQ